MYLKSLGKHFIIRTRSGGAGQVPSLSTSPLVGDICSIQGYLFEELH